MQLPAGADVLKRDLPDLVQLMQDSLRLDFISRCTEDA